MRAFKERLKEAQNTLAFTDFPIQVVLETASVCNLQCEACPSRLLQRRRGKLPYPLFKQVVDEIAANNKDTELYPAYMGEPLSYGPLVEGIGYAKKKGLNKIYLNTNAMLLDKKMAIDLLDVGVDRIIVSIDGFSAQTYEERRVKGDYEQVLKNTVQLLELADSHPGKTEIWAQMIIDDGNKFEEESFKQFWLEKGAIVKIRPQLTWGGRVGKNSLADVELDRIPCPWLMRQIVITIDGEAALCDADHEATCDLGNIKQQSIKEIWSSSYKSIQTRHNNGDYQYQLCRDCDDWKVGISEVFRP
jgi:radical SAM protein with 4Fe4S-binding SPASM domain